MTASPDSKEEKEVREVIELLCGCGDLCELVPINKSKYSGNCLGCNKDFEVRISKII
jgi:hypothetical protein